MTGRWVQSTAPRGSLPRDGEHRGQGEEEHVWRSLSVQIESLPNIYLSVICSPRPRCELCTVIRCHLIKS